MGGDHHHGPPYKVPDWRIYKVEDAPELMQVQEALADKGLKDPWLRNEVWRYNVKEFSTHGQRFRGFFFRGLGLGLALATVTIAGETLYSYAYPDKHGHGHGHGNGDHGNGEDEH